MIKRSSIIDKVQETLAPEIWDENKKMSPKIRYQALLAAKRIAVNADSGDLGGVFMLGSLTGFKYNPTSDIDILVAIKELKPDKEKTHGAKKFNGFKAAGTDREINYFLTDFRDDTKKNLASIPFGVYDLIEDRWLNEPPKVEDVLDTYTQFWSEFLIADAKARHFNAIAKSYKKEKRKLESMEDSGNRRDTLTEYYQIQKQKFKVKTLFEEAVDFIERVDKDRKFAYSTGWGSGRESKQNVIFKVLQYTEHGELFSDILDHISTRNLKKRKSVY